MARYLRFTFLLTVLSILCSMASAQPQTAAAQANSEVDVTLGQSAIALNGPWKFTIGDSPVDPKTSQPLWATPEFDDSRWETVDLTPSEGAVDPISGLSGFVPGWTVRGHKGYWGYAWYRIRVRVQAKPGEELALAGPSDVDDVYQVFTNGMFVGQFGKFSQSTPTAFYSQPMKFPLPKQSYDGSGSGTDISTLVLAFRVFMMPSTLTEAADVGGFHNAPVLGEAATVTARYHVRWMELTRHYSFKAAELPLSSLLALLAFTLILFDRSDRVYLWIGGVFLLQVAISGLSSAATWTQLVSITTIQLVGDGLLTSLIFAGWVMVWWVWFGRQRPSWTPRAATGLALLYLVTIVIGQEMFVGLAPHPVATAFLSASMLVRLLFLALQLWIVFQGIRRYGLEGWMVLPAVLLWGVNAFGTEMSRLHLPIRWELFGMSIRLGTMSDLLLMVVIALLLLRRLLKSIHNQQHMALDVKQAQEVQSVILPESRTELPGLVVESEYRPAREVGGDFFQIIPHKSDGSLLIVAGDVTGKGLKAGMLVALLVGAIRSTAELNSEPLFLLQALNRRMLGRGDAQATCLAIKITKEGEVTLANAGHIMPYLNGEPMAMEGALPLGAIEDAEFSIMHFQLEDEDKLVLMSDGIAEATNVEGRLFGFERVHELLRAGNSAAELANTAQQFGQKDDISIISVLRTVGSEALLYDAAMAR